MSSFQCILWVVDKDGWSWKLRGVIEGSVWKIKQQRETKSHRLNKTSPPIKTERDTNGTKQTQFLWVIGPFTHRHGEILLTLHASKLWCVPPPLKFPLKHFVTIAIICVTHTHIHTLTRYDVCGECWGGGVVCFMALASTPQVLKTWTLTNTCYNFKK